MNKPYRVSANQHHRLQRHGRTVLLGVALLLGIGGIALAAITPDVANTRHNLSASNASSSAAGSSFAVNPVKATSETQICVFCHTPHSATAGVVAPLWNRNLSTATYSFYKSASLDATDAPVTGSGTVGDGSKMCLSCHDGTIAIGTVGVLNGAPQNIAMEGTNPDGTMPAGMGENTGFTRRIGVNLSNDHPISFTYDSNQVTRDGELYVPGNPGVAVANRVRGQPVKPQFPLIGDKMECITCHDPHLKTDALDPVTFEPINNKFLRGNRFQLTSPTPTSAGITAAYDSTKDIMCLACHNKPTWATSTHANVQATSERYKSSASDLRDFPRNIKTWQAACANCHDMHTVPGSRRLLREGTDNTFSPKIGGGEPAVEQVCYQCHSPSMDRILVKESPDQVPDIKTAFGYAVHMPVVTAEQGEVPAGGGITGNTRGEIHDIGTKASTSVDTAFGTLNTQRGKDFIEPRSLMGAGDLKNRHAECTDCHQPHRVTRTVLFNGDATLPAEKGTHRHGGVNDIGGVPHNNIASGSQRGQFGVEPEYGSASFYDEPTSFIEKRGPVNSVGGTAISTAETTAGDYAVTNTWLTREYQVCAKCHSNYAFGNLQGSIANPANISPLGRTGGTPAGTNGMMFYTNIFREIQAPVSHMREVSTTDSGAYRGRPPYTRTEPDVNFQTNNHRSWHPVMGPTGRTPAVRGNLTASNWLAPWDAIGEQTMYCTDCHGSQTKAGASTQPIDGAAEGPHGSDNIFLLKGWWDSCTGKPPSMSGCLDESSTTVASNKTLNPAVTRPDESTTDNDLCFKCHSPQVYRDGSAIGIVSGFSGGLGGNGHGHNGLSTKGRCMWCHVAIVHGWKNKAFLVNLNDVGPEATCRQEDADDAPDGYKCSETVGIGNPMPRGTQVRIPALPQPNGSTDPNYWASRRYSNPPYYRGAILKIASFAKSGGWFPSNCGSAGLPGGGGTASTPFFGFSDPGVGWMGGGTGEGCSGVP